MQAPSKSTIHCNHIANYVIKLLAPFNQGRPLTWQMSKSYPRTKQLNDLTPFTNYCASIYFVTDGNFQSPISDGRCITTPATGNVADIYQCHFPQNYIIMRRMHITLSITECCCVIIWIQECNAREDKYLFILLFIIKLENCLSFLGVIVLIL